MNPLTQPKVISLLTVVFIAGGVVGAVGGFNYGKQSFIRTFTAPPKPKDMTQHILEKLQRELSLTEAQTAAISPILAEQVKQMDQMHRDSMKQIGSIISNYDEQIKKQLTADQLKLWDEMKARDRERWERGRSHGPGSHGPPPPWGERTNTPTGKPEAMLPSGPSLEENRDAARKCVTAQ